MNLNEWRKIHPSLFTTSPPLTADNSMYIKLIDLLAENATSSKTLQIPADAPSGVYSLTLPSIYNAMSLKFKVLNQGSNFIWDSLLAVLHASNPVLTLSYDPSVDEGSGLKAGHFSCWAYNTDDDSAWVDIAGNAELGRAVAFVKHVQGAPTDAMKLTDSGEGWSANYFITTVLIQQIS